MKRKRDSEEDSHVPTRREKERNDRYAALVRDSPKIFIVYKGAMTAAKEVGEDTEDVKEEGKGKGREEGEERSQVALRVVTLPHPATGEPVRYGVAGRTLLELQQMRPVNNLGSWFIGEETAADGTLHVATPIDPRFLLIPLLLEGQGLQDGTQPVGRFVNIPDALAEARMRRNLPLGLGHLWECAKGEQLEEICEVKEAGGMQFYRLSEEKVLTWACKKLPLLIDALLQHDSDIVAHNSHSVLVEKREATSAEVLQKAVAILAEYLPEELSKKVRERLGVVEGEGTAEVTEEQMRQYKNATDIKGRFKKPSQVAEESAAKPKPAATITQKTSQKKLAMAKEKLGLKQISSFFSPPPAKKKK